MADRIPLIVNPGASQIQELPIADNLVLSGQLKLTGTTTTGASDILLSGGSDAAAVITVTESNGSNVSKLIIDGKGSHAGADKIAEFIMTGTTPSVDITGALNVSSNLDVDGATTLDGLTVSEASTFSADIDLNGSMDISTTLTLSSSATSATRFIVSATTDSSSETTGSATFAGGVGIAKKLYVGDDITAFASSDVTLKENITPISNAIDKVLSISGNTFTWNEKSAYSGEEGTGIIAQEIEALGLPGVTETRKNGTKAVRYDRLVPLLIEAIKELDGKVKSLEK